MAERRAQESSEKIFNFLPREENETCFFSTSFHLAVARSAAKSFSLAAGNCLDRALRRTNKKNIAFVSFSERY